MRERWEKRQFYDIMNLLDVFTVVQGGTIMGFMSAYKHLDNLCKDINGKGVTGYIEDMERNNTASFSVSGWQDDYKQLKHYRWVRNQIAHENYADEDNMCRPEDTEWLDNFYNRILNRTDPLAKYRTYRTDHIDRIDRIDHTVSTPRTIPRTNSYNYEKEWKKVEEKPKKRNTSRIIAYVLLAFGIIFLVFTWNHPEISWPWENKVTYTIYGGYVAVMVAFFISANRKR